MLTAASPHLTVRCVLPDLLVVEIAWSRVTQCVMGHRGKVTALSSAGRCAVSAAEDEVRIILCIPTSALHALCLQTIRIWNTSTMACTAVVDSSVSALVRVACCSGSTSIILSCAELLWSGQVCDVLTKRRCEPLDYSSCRWTHASHVCVACGFSRSVCVMYPLC